MSKKSKTLSMIIMDSVFLFLSSINNKPFTETKDKYYFKIYPGLRAVGGWKNTH